MKPESKLAGLGLLTAISASLCCITPVLALLAGTSGLASTFAWLDPLRPYLIGLTVVVLGLAWRQKLKPRAQVDCDCDTTVKTPFIQTKTFLGIVTVFSGLMLAFPAYSHNFFQRTGEQTILVEPENMQTAAFTIRGMTCSGCEDHVNHEVNKLSGIIDTKVSYANGNAIIAFDRTQTDMEEIEKAIEKTGYAVIEKREVE